MTAKARKTINDRPGNAAPASVRSGSASAAASETAPRIPIQPISAASSHRGASPRLRRRSACGPYTNGKTQASRTAITVAATMAASPISVDADCPPSALQIGRSWRPTSTKRSEFARNVSVPQTGRA